MKRFAGMPARKQAIVEKFHKELAAKRKKAVLLSLEESRDNMSHSKWEGDLHNGFACPKCGEELEDENGGGIFESMPAQKGVECICGFYGTRYVTD